MSFRRGVRIVPVKTKAASIFGGARPAAAALAINWGERPAKEDDGYEAKDRPELNLQMNVVRWFRHFAMPLGSTLHATPNGMWMADRARGEARSEKTNGRIARMMKLQRKAGVTRGIKDLFFAWPAHDGAAAGSGWIEMKAPGGTYAHLEEDQREQILGFLRAGQRVGIAQSMFDVQDILEGWGVRLRQHVPEAERPVPHPQRQKWPLADAELGAMILATTDPALLVRWGYKPAPDPRWGRTNRGKGETTSVAEKK